MRREQPSRQFVVTLDLNVGYAALSDPNMKDVVVLARLFKEYKHITFRISVGFIAHGIGWRQRPID